MEITYIGHSGFLIEWETCYWLFDYYKGTIPSMNPEKKIIVFASHKHQDHFNPEILYLCEKYPKIQFVLSSDIKLSENELDKFGKQDHSHNSILSVHPSCEYELCDDQNNTIHLRTLKSTDCGVAFLLRYQGKTIYHAGDLNLWVWKEETKQYNNNMTAMFQNEMNTLKDIAIDVAFAPLDPRQEEFYYMGLETLMNTAKVQYVFPMHFWDNPMIIEQFKRDKAVNNSYTEIMDISQEGQKWKISL